MPESAYPPPVRPPSARPSANRPGEPPAVKAPPAVAVVLATTPGARLACAEGTLVDRLADQLLTLEVTKVVSVFRPEPATAREPAHDPGAGATPEPAGPFGASERFERFETSGTAGTSGTSLASRTTEIAGTTGIAGISGISGTVDGGKGAEASEADTAVVEAVMGTGGDPVIEDAGRVIRSTGLVGDLRAVAAIARAGGGPVAVFPGDLVAHTEALALLLADPARGTGALVAAERDVPSPAAPSSRAPVRAERGRVVAAGNSFHTVAEPNARFRAVLHVGEADLSSLAEVAEELANLARDRRLGGADDSEVADLLLAGLVRVGVAVRAVPLGRLHCARVSGQRDADAAIVRLAEVDEDRARLAAAVKSDDGFVATFLVSSWSGHLVRAAARLGLTPNAVTGLSVGLAGLSAVAFSAGQRRAQLAGAVLLFLSFVLDCVDGQLARYTRAFSPLGAWLDATFDRVKEYVVYVGLAVGYAGGADGGVTGPQGVWALAVAAMLVQAIRHMIDFSYAGARADAAGVDPIWERPGLGGSPDLPVHGGGDLSGARSTPAASRRGPAAGAAVMAGGTGPVAVRRGGGGLVVRLSARLDRNTASRWLKKIIVLPIGERMVLIAVTAGLFNARVTFLALLAWGGVAALYTLTGRIARSL
ncbi:CDP-alcohol phosphatidyltransferase family protein [Sphaerisporangium sp. NPDC004334]